MPQLPLSIYLEMLRHASAEDGPFSHYKDSDAISEAFARMTTAMADFVEAAQALPAVGYEGARATLEDVVHMFPTGENPLAAIIEALKTAQKAPKAAPGKAEALPTKDAEAIADEFAKFLDGIPTAEDPFDKKED